jgi:rod shape-determining protein MreD
MGGVSMSREPLPTNWVAVLFFLITGYVIVFAQARVEAFRNLTGTQLDLLPGMMVYAAMAFHPGIIVGCALVLGALFDSLSANVLGTTTLSLALLGIAAMRYRELLLSDQFITHWVLGLLASAAAPLISIMVLHLAGAEPLIGMGSLWHWAVVTAGGGFFTPVWFKLFNRLDDALRFKELSESTFRLDREIARGKH